MSFCLNELSSAGPVCAPGDTDRCFDVDGYQAGDTGGDEADPGGLTRGRQPWKSEAGPVFRSHEL